MSVFLYEHLLFTQCNDYACSSVTLVRCLTVALEGHSRLVPPPAVVSRRGPHMHVWRLQYCSCCPPHLQVHLPVGGAIPCIRDTQSQHRGSQRCSVHWALRLLLCSDVHSLGPHWYSAVDTTPGSLWGAGGRDLLCRNSHSLLALHPQGEGEAYMGCVGDWEGIQAILSTLGS